MRCEEFRAASRDFAWRRAAPETAAACDGHLRACGDCAGWFGRACGMTCRELTDFLGEYLGGRMDRDRASVFEDHVHLCTECETYLDGYRKTVELGCDACSDDTPVPDRLVTAILAAKARGSGDGPQKPKN